MDSIMLTKKDYAAPKRGSENIGSVIMGLGANINDIIFENAALPDDAPEPTYNQFSNLSEVGEVCRDKFEFLETCGSMASAVSSGLGSSQAVEVK